jgi:hypothetical protein
MKRWLRRLLILLVIGGSGVAFRAAKQKRAVSTTESLGPSTEWPPLQAVPAPAIPHPHEVEQFTAMAVPSTPTFPAPATAVAAPASAGAGADWILPVDGACPDGYPIKANDNSGIFHVPGGRFYDRTVPERCYANTEAAERDGYRRAKA